MEMTKNTITSETNFPTSQSQQTSSSSSPPPLLTTYSETSISDDMKTTLSLELDTLSSLNDSNNQVNADVEENRSSLLLEFNDLFASFDIEAVRKRILNLEMTKCSFTTVVWRVFLKCLPSDSNQWAQKLDESRDSYDELLKNYLDFNTTKDKTSDKSDCDHPLSQSKDSAWNRSSEFKQLKENIRQDVIRTCQEIEFFQQKHVLDLLLNILFIHSRLYTESLEYRQGMHEILAVIVHSIHMESIKVMKDPESSELMKKIYDPVYLAHDSFALYEKVMHQLQPFYDYKTTNSDVQQKGRVSNDQCKPFQRHVDEQVRMNDTVKRVSSVFERMRDHDLTLYNKLKQLGIDSTLYGIRWLRLLFGREIPFDSIPCLWTVIFCYDENFTFVDYVFLGLLMKIGEIFHSQNISDYSCCLQLLMQPNVVTDVEAIINLALNLEKKSQFNGSVRSSPGSPVESANNRSVTKEIQRPTSPILIFSQNPMIDSAKGGAANRIPQSPLSSKSSSPKVPMSSEMSELRGAETRRMFEENCQVQKDCAELMNKFIDRMRNQIDGQQIVNDRISIQLNGLVQIANVLNGAIPFDQTTFEALLNYGNKAQSAENDNSSSS